MAIIDAHGLLFLVSSKQWAARHSKNDVTINTQLALSAIHHREASTTHTDSCLVEALTTYDISRPFHGANDV